MSGLVAIKKVNVKPYPDSVLPSLRFDIELSYMDYGEAVVSIGGWLLSDDRKILSCLHEATLEAPRSWDIAAKGSALDDAFREKTFSVSLVASLTKEALEHIEERGEWTKKAMFASLLSSPLK